MRAHQSRLQKFPGQGADAVGDRQHQGCPVALLPEHQNQNPGHKDRAGTEDRQRIQKACTHASQHGTFRRPGQPDPRGTVKHHQSHDDPLGPQIPPHCPGNSPQGHGHLLIKAPPLSHFPNLLIVSGQQNRSNPGHKKSGKEAAESPGRLPGATEDAGQDLLPGLNSKAGRLLLHKGPHRAVIYPQHSAHLIAAATQKLLRPPGITPVNTQPLYLNVQIAAHKNAHCTQRTYCSRQQHRHGQRRTETKPPLQRFQQRPAPVHDSSRDQKWNHQGRQILHSQANRRCDSDFLPQILIFPYPLHKAAPFASAQTDSLPKKRTASSLSILVSAKMRVLPCG